MVATESVSAFLVQWEAKPEGNFQCAFIKPQVADEIIVGASAWVDIDVRTLL